MHGGQSDLHIIIHGRGQKLSLLRLIPYKQSAEETRSSQQGRQAFLAVKQTFFGGQIETPNAAKTTSGILLVISDPRDGNRIFANPDNFVNKAEKANR